jgi:SAM-dependent methyltransferase
MSGFSPDWLALREPADHRSRSAALARRLADALAEHARLAIVDLGCGTGSNLRAIARLLPAPEQHWMLVDHDAGLLDGARREIARWAGATARAGGGPMRLRVAGKALTVELRQADLAGDLDDALGDGPNLVTAAAFFDLCSEAFIGRLAGAIAGRQAAFYTVLTYDGRQSWQPAHPADVAMVAAFHTHQATDKGLGRAAGPLAPNAVAEAFRAAGYAVEEADSPWRLGLADAALVRELAKGYADAVRETGAVPSATIDDWSSLPRTGAVVGHRDTLALPPR